MARFVLRQRDSPCRRARALRRLNLTAKDALQAVIKTALVAATLAALYLLFLLRHLVLTAFIAIIVATALRPAVSAVSERLRLSRPAASLALYSALAVALLAGTAAFVPSMVADAASLLERAPEIYGRWYGLASGLRESLALRLNLVLPDLPSQPQVAAWAAGLAAGFQQALPALALTTGGALGDILVALVLAYYWPEARDGLVSFVREATPAEDRGRLVTIGQDIERVLEAFVVGQLALSLLIGVASLLAFMAIGLPDPLLLASLSGLLHIIPLIGAAIGAIPAVLVALSISPTTGLLTVAALLVIHQVENAFIAPRVLERQVGLSPILIMIALMAGAALDGVIGAVIAVPAAGVLWILARDLLVGPVTARRKAEREAPGVPVEALEDEAGK